jgi:DNA-binding GntR family transcriptional regulator
MPARLSAHISHNAPFWHGRVLDAIERGDADSARRAIARHIRNGLEWRLAHFSEGPSETPSAEDLPPALQAIIQT